MNDSSSQIIVRSSIQKPSKYLSSLPSIKHTPRQSVSPKDKKQSKLRIIAEERDLTLLSNGGSVMGDTFFPDNLMLKHPFSGLDSMNTSNGPRGDLDAFSLTYTSYWPPAAPIISPATQDRKLKTRVLPKRILPENLEDHNIIKPATSLFKKHYEQRQ